MDLCFIVAITFAILRGFRGTEVLKAENKIRCALPKLGHNVLYRLNNEGNRLYYDCRRGYLTLGDVFDECKQGQWSHEPPLCIAHGCKPVYYIDHGHVILGYGGAMIKFSCDEGFNIVGDRIMICDGKNWNTTIPKCKDSSQDERHEEIAYSHKQEKTKSHTDWLLEADYSCIKRKSSIRPPSIKHAIVSAQWAIVKDKPRLFTVYRCHWGYTHESKARYLYCQNGKWIGALPKCRAAVTHNDDMMSRDQPITDKTRRTHASWLQMSDYSCIGSTKSPKQILPDPIPDGQYSLRHDVIDGKPRLYAELVCNHGYRRYHGNKYVYCLKKSWIGPKMMCVRNENGGNTYCAVHNGGCDHFCEMLEEVVSCSCKEGYILSKNGQTCVDIDECQNDSSDCKHVCHNTLGGYTCHCYIGYQLSEDNHSCKPDPEYKGRELIPPMALFSH